MSKSTVPYIVHRTHTSVTSCALRKRSLPSVKGQPSMMSSAVSKAATKSELFSRKFVLLDGALKRFRRTFDPVIEAVISLNWQYSNDLALPRTGTPERPMKIDSLTDGVFMRHLQVAVSDPIPSLGDML